EIEDLDAHRAPRRPGKDLPALRDEAFPFDVLVVLVIALHVQHVEIDPAVFVDIDGTCVPGPPRVLKTDFRGHVDESVPALVAEEHAPLRAFREPMKEESVLRDAHVVAVSVAGN